MVVEDEPDIYEVLLAMFEMWGIEGVAFVDGEEAIAWIEDVDEERFKGELPELALLDIRLPGNVSGADVAARLRQSPILGQAAIVLSTAYRLSADEEREVLDKSDADKLMYKPLPRFNELQKVLEEVIAERRAKASVMKSK
jgi:CheY-like chemotaxis protein